MNHCAGDAHATTEDFFESGKKEIRKIETQSLPSQPFLLSRKSLSSIETRSAPALLGATHRAFSFYLGNPFPRFCFPD
jgi:hypothetical protein